jgi:hypothetical protein
MTPDLQFAVVSVEAARFAVSPHIALKLRVTSTFQQRIHSIILRCQVQIEPARRRYASSEQMLLTDLFGQPEMWGQTLRGLLWNNISVVIPSFSESVVVDVHVPCTFDFNVAATKYFAGLEGGDVPVSLFFSGSVFYETDIGLQVSQIPWDKEASCRLPIRVWKDMMNSYYPDMTWLCLERGIFDRLYAYKVRHGLPTFEQALTHVLEAADR